MNRSSIRQIFEGKALSSETVRSKALELATEYLAGGWDLLNHEELKVEKITGGMSNLMFLVSSESPKLTDFDVRRFLIKIFCQPDDKQVFRDTLVFSVLAERGLGPKLYGVFNGGRLEEYLPSKTFNEDDIRVPINAFKIGQACARFHDIDVPISKKPQALITIKKWLTELRGLGFKKHDIKPIFCNYHEKDIPKSVTIEELENELVIFDNWSQVFSDTVVFCHNDLVPANILELNDTKEVVLIDCEYATYNWRGYDLGNHQCDYAHDYRVKEPPFYKIDIAVFEENPNIVVKSAAYIDALYKMKEKDPSRKFPRTEDREEEIEDLMKECMFFWPLDNLFWAIWSLKSLANGHDTGVDLETATSERLAVYFHLKPRSSKIFEEVRRRKKF